MLEGVQYRILKLISPGAPPHMSGSTYAGKSKVSVLLGEDFWKLIQAVTVIDFGCGKGAEAVEIAERGAARVIGVDILENNLVVGRQLAKKCGVEATCEFKNIADEPADMVLSLDAFEHFAEPEKTLETMRRLLKPGGRLVISFGPPWFHPLGGHLFSVFPWAHLIFGEKALIRWRSDIRHDGATRFCEVEGGLNQMTIRRFEQMIRASGLGIEFFRCVPIRKLAWLHGRVTREFTTATVRCVLRLPAPKPTG